MGRRRKAGRGGDTESEDPQKTAKLDAAAKATTSLGSLIKAAGITQVKAPTKSPRVLQPVAPAGRAALASPARSAPSPVAELRMLNDAYAGALPLARKEARQVAQRPIATRVSEADREAELAARKRIAALVSGGVRFKIKREDEYVEGYRSEASSKLLGRLAGKGFTPEATLDLHGERVAKVSDVVAGFVRGHHRRGARHLLVIVGKGLHSHDGVGVLLPAVTDALTQGLAAPLVRAFTSAHPNHGGTGAIAVLLI
jgi:DNA-nicking Smr family endonuclease